MEAEATVERRSGCGEVIERPSPLWTIMRVPLCISVGLGVHG